MLKSLLLSLIGVAVIGYCVYLMSAIFYLSPEQWPLEFNYWSVWLISIIGCIIFAIQIVATKKPALSIPSLFIFNPFTLLSIFAALMWLQLNSLEKELQADKHVCTVEFLNLDEVKVGHIRNDGGGRDIMQKVVKFSYEIDGEKHTGTALKPERGNIDFKKVWVSKANPKMYVHENFDFSWPYKIPFAIGLLFAIPLGYLVVKNKHKFGPKKEESTSAETQ